MSWLNSSCDADAVSARISWFLSTQLPRKIERVHLCTGIATATLRRYSLVAGEAALGPGSGPLKVPVLLRILDALDVSPARLAVAAQHASDEAAFWGLMSARLCLDQKIRLKVDCNAPPHVDRRLIRLADPSPRPLPERSRATTLPYRYGALQNRIAWYLGEQLKGRFDHIHERTGIAPATLRRYTELDPTVRGRTGAQKVRALCEILDSLGVNRAKLIVAAQYAADDSSFWSIMSSDLCFEAASGGGVRPFAEPLPAERERQRA